MPDDRPPPSPPSPPLAQSSGLSDLSPRHGGLQAALDLIDQGFTLIDGDLRMVAWNQTFLRLLDFPDELAWVGAPFEGFMRYNAQRGEYGPGDPDLQVRERMLAASRFTAHTLERTRPDGTVLLVRGVPVPGHGFVTLYSDITAQRAAERQIQQHAAVLEQRVAERTAELRRSEAQMRLITDSIPALVAYFDRHRNYRYINRGYKAWFGLDPDHPERVSAKAYLGAATYAGIRPNVARALAGEPVTYEYEVDIVGGTRLIARTTLIPEVDVDGQVAGCFELTFDITEQKRSQAMLVQAQKMEALGQLTGGLAHDFNNILTVVIGNLEGLRRARPDDPAMAESIEPALLAAHRGADLIRRLMSFSRQQPLAAKATDVGRLLDEVARLVRRTLPEDRQLDLRPCTVSVWAWADAHQLQNSLLNLIFNARDATAAGGRIALGLEVHDVAATAATELGLRPGPHVRLVVSDNGCGMDRATQERVFEPFFTTKPPGHGTGLGLAMVYGFITQSAGAIRIDSAPGAGTTVSLWLPACEAPLEDVDVESPASPAPAGSRGLALLVEDDAAVRQVVRRDLLALGFAVLEAENGPEALEILDCTPAITLVLTDGVMPGGVDGRQVAAHARRQRVPQVLLMSGYAPGASPDEGQPILPKPFTREQLAARLESGDGR